MSTFFSRSELAVVKAPASLVPKCGECGLYKKCASPKLPVSGKGGKGILVVGYMPEDDEGGSHFSGESYILLQAAFRKSGVDIKQDCWLTNALICHAKDGAPKNAVDACRPNLIRTVKELQPTTVILLGQPAVKSLVGWLWKEDVGSLAEWVGWQIPNQRLNAWLCPAYHPKTLLTLKDAAVHTLLFERHIEQALQFQARPWGRVPDYRSQVQCLTDAGEAARAVREFVAAGRPVAFDYETNMLKPDSRQSEIVCCAVSDGKRSVAFPWVGAAVPAVRELLFSDVPKYGYNIKFEERWTLAKLGGPVRNWVHDGMLAAHVLDNRSGITSLKFQAFVRLGVEDYDSHIKPYLKSKGGGNDKNRIHLVSMQDLLTYCGLDALLEYKVSKLQAGDMTYQED